MANPRCLLSLYALLVLLLWTVVVIQAKQQQQQQQQQQQRPAKDGLDPERSWHSADATFRQEQQHADLWETYKQTYNKSYSRREEPLRRKLWEESVEFVQRHNLEYDLGLHTYTVGINEYADMTPYQYKKYLLGFRPSAQDFRKTHNPRLFEYDRSQDLPDTVDWRQQGYVTEIKNQGQCGSCWAFSSTGALEGQHFRKTGKLVSLSEQNLVDCCSANAGCDGGWMMNAFTYVNINRGIDTEDSYPYEGQDDQCRYSSSERGASDTGYVMTPEADEQALKSAVAKVGPVSVAIDASQRSFQLYRSGVYVEPQCSRNITDHAVLVVGYGVYSGISGSQAMDYWLVKNSWGTSWGDNGYIMMARNMDNQCAIASYACFPIE